MSYNFSPKQVPESIGQIIFAGFEEFVEKEKWQMTDCERCTLITLLNLKRPECAIEIGTAQGGSLSVLSHFAKKVYSLDVDPTCHDRLGHKFANVEFITGRSQDTLPPLLKRLRESGTHIGFILIDGDHTKEGVRQDIDVILSIKPTQLLYIVMHDSFNPYCRAGILSAPWQSSPYVHFVEVDFVPGNFFSRQDIFKQMWAGFGLALMLPEKRANNLQIQASQELIFQTVFPYSTHYPLPPPASSPLLPPLDYQIATLLVTRMRNMKLVQKVLKSESLRKSLRNVLLRLYLR
jgi:hypothetical protein